MPCMEERKLCHGSTCPHQELEKETCALIPPQKTCLHSRESHTKMNIHLSEMKMETLETENEFRIGTTKQKWRWWAALLDEFATKAAKRKYKWERGTESKCHEVTTMWDKCHAKTITMQNNEMHTCTLLSEKCMCEIFSERWDKSKRETRSRSSWRTLIIWMKWNEWRNEMKCKEMKENTIIHSSSRTQRGKMRNANANANVQSKKCKMQNERGHISHTTLRRPEGQVRTGGQVMAMWENVSPSSPVCELSEWWMVMSHATTTRHHAAPPCPAVPRHATRPLPVSPLFTTHDTTRLHEPRKEAKRWKHDEFRPLRH